MKIIETLYWRAKNDVSDARMIEAVEAMLPDLRGLPGFLEQTLYKTADGRWLDVYYWETEEDVNLSNERMADTQSLKNLLEIIDLESVAIDVMKPVQDSAGKV